MLSEGNIDQPTSCLTVIVGTLAGSIIALTTTLVALCVGSMNADDIIVNASFAFSGLDWTLLIVSWEELWFRGLFLKHARKQFSSVQLSLIIGFLFMLLHLLNPEINLLFSGPALFFAGAMLTMVYFRFKNIWLPIGLHFGNNAIGSTLETSSEHHFLFWERWLFECYGYGGRLFILCIKRSDHGQ